MILPIVTFQDKNSDILSRPAKKIKVFNEKLRKLAGDTKETMEVKDGLGLAAPQVNCELAFCIVSVDGKIECLCNPRVTSLSKKTETGEEGCLSFPGIFIKIPRSVEIEVEYQDLGGIKRKLKAKDLLARTLQHEIDHLKGSTFLEKLNS